MVYKKDGSRSSLMLGQLRYVTTDLLVTTVFQSYTMCTRVSFVCLSYSAGSDNEDLNDDNISDDNDDDEGTLKHVPTFTNLIFAQQLNKSK